MIRNMADDTSELDAIDREVERALERQRRTVDTCRILVVFAAGVGASVGAAAWQTIGATFHTLLAASLLGLSIAFTIYSFLADEREEIDIEKIVDEAAHGGHKVQDAISSWNRAASEDNELYVTDVINISIAQVIASFTAAGLSTVAMLLGVQAP